MGKYKLGGLGFRIQVWALEWLAGNDGMRKKTAATTIQGVECRVKGTDGKEHGSYYTM